MTGTEIAVLCAVGFGGALLGALVGGLTTALLEFWKQVLAGQAAARVVQYEIQENVNRCVQAINSRHPGVRLVDEAWKAHRLQLAPLLPREVYMQLATSYGAIFIVDEWVRRIESRFDESRCEIEQWLKPMTRHAALLLQVQARKRSAQFIDALLGRPTFPPPRSGRKDGPGASPAGAEEGECGKARQ